MKKFAILVASAMCVASPAFAYDRDDVREQESELRSSKRMVDEDNRAIDKYEDYKEQNRAEKAGAKANKEYGRQAKESVEIGANDMAIGTNKAKRKLDRKLVDKNRREVEQARENEMEREGRYSDRRYAPSSGQQTFFGFRAEPDYPQAPTRPTARMNEEIYARSDTNSSY